MSNLSNSMGDGGSGGRPPGAFTDTGYGTHDGMGNVPTGAESQEGTGYDEHGQVKTQFGRYQLAYDPVSGMAIDNVTAAYDFPAGGGMEGGAGLVDVSAPGSGAGATHATPAMQAQLQQFFEQRSRAAPAEGGAAGGAPAPAPPEADAASGERGQAAPPDA